MDDTRRPLDVLEETVDTQVTVELKDGRQYEGRLAGYDQHMNLVIEPDEGGGMVGGDTADAGAEDTTVIRGDNVVSIRS